MTAPPLLDVRDLRVAFGGKEVVHGIDLAIAPGEKLALVGESGSGKTVTALSLVRLVHGARVEGSARLASASAGAAPLELLHASERELLAVRGRDIAMIFQEPMTALNPLYTVGDQVAEVLQLKQGLSVRQAWEGAVEALAATGIPEPARRARSFPHQLSGGQRQRAMIAMALACRPRLLLADEPTTALDVTLRQQILELLADLQRQTGMAVLMITHDLNLVRRFADRVAVMENGHLVEQGSVAEVFARPRHPYTLKLMESRPVRDVQAPRAGEPPVMRAQALEVAYPVPIPGLRGWFRKGEFVAVQGAGFAVPPGGTLGIVGESGSGKSTLALAALGLVPHRGELEVVGKRWGPDAAANITRGPAIEKSIAPLRSYVFEPMRHGSLLLCGDAAHIVPPTGAKGLNLAASDVHYAAEALTGYFKRADNDAISGYSAKALARVWKSERFSWQLTKLMHRFPEDGTFERAMQVAELDYISTSVAAQTSISENYVGLPV